MSTVKYFDTITKLTNDISLDIMIRSPLELDRGEVVTWSRDKFGNPLPVPTLPLASLATSLLSLAAATTRQTCRRCLAMFECHYCS